jgi:hypothetical protein
MDEATKEQFKQEVLQQVADSCQDCNRKSLRCVKKVSSCWRKQKRNRIMRSSSYRHNREASIRMQLIQQARLETEIFSGAIKKGQLPVPVIQAKQKLMHRFASMPINMPASLSLITRAPGSEEPVEDLEVEQAVLGLIRESFAADTVFKTQVELVDAVREHQLADNKIIWKWIQQRASEEKRKDSSNLSQLLNIFSLLKPENLDQLSADQIVAALKAVVDSFGIPGKQLLKGFAPE